MYRDPKAQPGLSRPKLQCEAMKRAERTVAELAARFEAPQTRFRLEEGLWPTAHAICSTTAVTGLSIRARLWAIDALVARLYQQIGQFKAERAWRLVVPAQKSP